jgi:ATPase family associated with various cellular activities (AAA)
MRLDFPQLETLRLLARQIQQDQTSSLGYFAFGNGYEHFKGKGKVSVSSTATCVLSLVATGKWKDRVSKADTRALLEELIAKKTSAGLPDENPFTVAWILEAITALEPYAETLSESAIERIRQMEAILQDSLVRGGGGVRIDKYPPSAYLTQLVVRTLWRRNKIEEEHKAQVKAWSWPELTRQLTLIQIQSKTADAMAVAYLLMLVTVVTPQSEITSEETQIQRAGLKVIFNSQSGDGSWPLSQPLFHYKQFGNAYCYDYEMLTQLLSEQKLRELLLEYLPNLSLAAHHLLESAYEIELGVRAWASGHNPQLKGPESWTTASVYHFIHALDRLLAEAVRRELYRCLDEPYPKLAPKGKVPADFAKNLLDSQLLVKGELKSLREFLWERFVLPLSLEADGIAEGRRFRKETPRSAIFFGPPGTSKTDLSKEIAAFLGWPYLAIDPSYLLRNGMDGIQAEANNIFRMLEETEGVVVLFDEFDELVRERESSAAQPFSRLLTTAMLPKLANIHKSAALVFIIATNNIGEFDLAIRRPGRFDRVVQIMPPTADAKLARRDWGPGKVDVEAKLTSLSVVINATIRQHLEELTFSEFEAFATDISKVASPQDAMAMMTDAWQNCTLQTPVGKEEGKETWGARCKDEAKIHR